MRRTVPVVAEPARGTTDRRSVLARLLARALEVFPARDSLHRARRLGMNVQATEVRHLVRDLPAGEEERRRAPDRDGPLARRPSAAQGPCRVELGGDDL